MEPDRPCLGNRLWSWSACGKHVSPSLLPAPVFQKFLSSKSLQEFLPSRYFLGVQLSVAAILVGLLGVAALCKAVLFNSKWERIVERSKNHFHFCITFHNSFIWRVHCQFLIKACAVKDEKNSEMKCTLYDCTLYSLNIQACMGFKIFRHSTLGGQENQTSHCRPGESQNWKT